MNLQDNPRIALVRYDDPAEWTEAVASEMADLLEQEISRRGQARMLLSGGTTPAPVYESLAHRPLDWSRVEVGLVDERWLSPQDQDSNAWLVNHSFLTHAPAATFIPLVRPGKQLPECVHTANLQARHAEPACLAVLGMGGDGHTASLFPGATDLPKALASPQPYASLDATGCPGSNQWPLRITLTPAGLASIPTRLLLLRGKQKLDVLQAALAGDDVNEYPIRVALQQPGPRLRVHWCA
ncbi:6-phosphogluconolactonase [Xanthomonas axonopodis pv. cajani]|uniref:6-phosphogluconolactonase n=1 Tax=Xanthomonas axonopodis TaxID=53413 RepID=UPI0035571FF2